METVAGSATMTLELIRARGGLTTMTDQMMSVEEMTRSRLFCGIPFVTEQTLYVGNGGGVDLYDPNSRLRDPDTGLSAAAEDPETGCIYSLHHTGTKRDHAERVAGR